MGALGGALQAVGTHLRECLISFAHEIAEEDDPVPDGIAPPKSNDVTAWVALLAKAIAPALPTHVCAIPQGICRTYVGLSANPRRGGTLSGPPPACRCNTPVSPLRRP